jgi:hypothetical protein
MFSEGVSRIGFSGARPIFRKACVGSNVWQTSDAAHNWPRRAGATLIGPDCFDRALFSVTWQGTFASPSWHRPMRLACLSIQFTVWRVGSCVARVGSVKLATGPFLLAPVSAELLIDRTDLSQSFACVRLVLRDETARRLLAFANCDTGSRPSDRTGLDSGN